MVLYAVCWTIGIGLLLHWWGGVASADTRSGHYAVHVGDTLWSIAQSQMTGVDTRAAVNELVQMNHLEHSEIYPSESIVVPGK